MLAEEVSVDLHDPVTPEHPSVEADSPVFTVAVVLTLAPGIA